jgi:tRNA(fMet)-specific endonuclease VapC
MSYLLDTDICSAHLKQQGVVTNRFLQYGGRLHISVVSIGELLTWALRANAPQKRLQGVEDLLQDLVVIDATIDVARKFGELRAALLDSGRPTPEMEFLIAASALVHGLTLVTQNVKDFSQIPGLSVEDWLIP